MNKLATKRRMPVGGALLAAVVLAGCGGGEGGGEEAVVPDVAPLQSSQATEPGAPQFLGNTATDGFNWFNFRRQQAQLEREVVEALAEAKEVLEDEIRKRSELN